MSRRLDVAHALAEAAKSINTPRTLEETLDAIVHAALDSVPCFDQVGISIAYHCNGDSQIETKAGTSRLVWEIDALQYQLGEGPCVDAIREDAVIIVPDLEQEQRWPKYTPEAVEAGLRAQMGLRLYADGETLGALNLYSTKSTAIADDTLEVAELFATHAALALGRSRHEHHLNDAIATRKVIGQAIGIVMERYQIDEDRAFQFLVRVSSTSHIKLRMLAEEVVAGTNESFKGNR